MSSRASSSGSRPTFPGIYASGDRRASARRRPPARRAASRSSTRTAHGRRRSQDLADARELLAAETDAEMREYLQAEIAEKEARVAALEAEIKELLLPTRPERGPQRDRRDPGHRGRRGGQPLGRRPLPHVPALRRAPRPEDSRCSRASRPTRRLPRRHVRREGRRRVGPPQVRGRSAPRAAGARDREPGPHPHERGDGRGAARGRGGRRRDRPERPRDRRVPRRPGPAGSR